MNSFISLNCYYKIKKYNIVEQIFKLYFDDINNVFNSLYVLSRQFQFINRYICQTLVKNKILIIL